MAVNPNLLIAAPMLQDYFVDKMTGMPLAGGIVSMFEDTARQVYKNWYYQSGVPGAYTYVPLDNPLSLSSTGTIMDPNGNDVIPFFYPYEEDDSNTSQSYYVTVYSVDENGEPSLLQFTRENFPFVAPGGSSSLSVPTLQNYIINGEYWRNIGSINVNSVTEAIICPDQHDGYTNSDIRFIKDLTGATDTLSFISMTETLDDDVTPEYQLNYECTAAQIGETVKCIQYPISLHVETLQNQLAQLVIHAKNVSGSPNNFINLYLYQFLGTGAPTQPVPALIQKITLNENYEKFVIPFTFPDFNVNTSLTLGSGGDDALFLRVQYPVGVTCNISHCKPQIYLGEKVPTNQFSTYDQINSIISSSRTGDLRVSINTFFPWGWVPLNGGTIGNATSNATARANKDTWPLFNFLWNMGNTYINGTSNALVQMLNSSGSAVMYGANAITDFNSNNQLVLTSMMGKVLLGTVPFSAMLSSFSNTYVATNAGGNILITPTSLMTTFTGMPIVFTNTGGSLPGNLSTNAIYYVGQGGGSNFHVSTSFANALAGTFVAYSSAGSGTNTVTSAITGSKEGEYAHTLLSKELPDPMTSTADTADQGGGSGTTVITSGSSYASGIVSNQGGNQSHNITQPGSFYNVYMKL